MKNYYKRSNSTGEALIIKDLEGYSIGDWVWCAHCQRVYKVGEFREINIKGGIEQLCPYSDCDGSAVFDAWHWGGTFEPERNKFYDYCIG